MMKYEDCIHYRYEDTTPWHSDVFDHPSYTHYCVKDNIKKEIIPYYSCRRCIERRRENANRTEN